MQGVLALDAEVHLQQPGASPTPSIRAESVADELEARLAAAAARFGPTVARASARKKWGAVAPLTSATANHANVIDIASAFRGGDLSQPFKHRAHDSRATSGASAPATPPQHSPRHSPGHHAAFKDGGVEISIVPALDVARPSLGGHTPRLELLPPGPLASPLSSPRDIQAAIRPAGPDVSLSLMKSRSTVVDDCSNARASLQELSDDVKNFDARVQKRIQELRLEITQAKQQEESLATG
jgi:hypothetical protein